MVEKFDVRQGLMWVALFWVGMSLSLREGWAVTSKIARHSTSVDLLKGQAEDVVVGSQGTLQLGRAWEALVEDFDDVWSINSIVVSGGTVFIGTSPNGGIFKYSLGKLTKIYPTESEGPDDDESSGGPSEANVPGTKAIEADQYLLNEHVFAMTTDVAGRLLAGVSGEKCRLMRLERDRMEAIFEPNDAKYIFATVTDDRGHIYLGTGPEGKVYRLDSFGGAPEVIYESRDKNILSLATGEDGLVYAGSDGRGLVYKMDPRAGTEAVLYDSDQPEITALLFTESGVLYAAATSAKIVEAETKFASQLPLSGRPEAGSGQGNSVANGKEVLKLKIANIGAATEDKGAKRKPPARKGAKPSEASYVYKITGDGYVSDVFSESAVFFALSGQEERLLVGTGNSGQLFVVDPISEQEAVVYEDRQASQITAVAVSGEDVYLGTANPAKLIKLGKSFASEGTYTSDLIDAGQPAKWGKLQIEADIPQGCKVQVASRSGNVKDVNDRTFSVWTESVEVTGPVQLQCPLGRFCQYRLTLQSGEEVVSPVVREVAVASTVPNLAPKVESVEVSRVEAAGKMGVFKIGYKAKDDNGDKLVYKIDFRKVGWPNWVELKDELEADSFEWDGRTVEDGRYELRITACDERNNTDDTKLTGTRVSEPVVVDNTRPAIRKYAIEAGEGRVALKLQVSDELSAIEKADYTVDSNAEWKGVLPDDLVYDTTAEDFTVVIEDLEAGGHIIAIRVSDHAGNTAYKTFEVNVVGS